MKVANKHVHIRDDSMRCTDKGTYVSVGTYGHVIKVTVEHLFTKRLSTGTFTLEQFAEILKPHLNND